jgi:hypothetical protein
MNTNELQSWSENLARANGTDSVWVLEMWHQYAANCTAFDQSPTRDEFLRWYRLETPWVELELFEL